MLDVVERIQRYPVRRAADVRQDLAALNSPNRVVIAAVKTQRLGRQEIHIGAVADKPNAQEIEEKLVPPGIRRAHRRAELDKGRVAADAGLVDRSGIGKRPAFARLKRQRQVASALR